ncbi:hypothetical protein Tco_0171995 [Tanacetum coccineum]
MIDNKDNRRLDVFGASVISRRHRVLCDLGLTFHYFRRRSSRNRRSFVSNTSSRGNTFQVLLRLVTVLLGRVPEVEAVLEVTNLESISVRLTHLEFEELELDKQEVEQPEVDRFDLDEPGVSKLKLD